MSATTRIAALLALAGLLASASAASAAANDSWWQDALFYRIFVPSFQDTDADGVGDLNGIQNRLTYLSNISVDAIILSPIFNSTMAGGGYDSNNFTAVNSLIGNTEDLDALLNKSRIAGIKVILEIDPVFTSDSHPWFNYSAQRKEPYTNFYIWAGNNQSIPPNKMRNVFNESAWTWHPVRKQFYYHTYSRHEPDLNYFNETVQSEMAKVLEYWLSLNVDGFLVLSVPFLVKRTNVTSKQDFGIGVALQPETYDLIAQWRQIVDNKTSINGTERVLLVEVSYVNAGDAMLLLGNMTANGAHLVIHGDLVLPSHNSVPATSYIMLLSYWLLSLPFAGVSAWETELPGENRTASRTSAVDAMNAITLLLPGASVVNYGQELGLPDVDHLKRLPRNSPGSMLANWSVEVYDFSRTLFPWDDSSNLGFSNSSQTWLPVVSQVQTVQQQFANESSYLSVFKNLLDLNMTGPVQMHFFTVDVLMLIRDNFWVLLNFGEEASVVNLWQLNSSQCMIIDISNSQVNFTKGSTIWPNTTNLPGGGVMVMHECGPTSKSSTHRAVWGSAALVAVALLVLN